ncbi:hypothetical protein IGW_05067 [Bacillus cereus ISP3191]|nr:hypothetical protein IGW_05067 [Bacillus cereus ISP3191]MDR4323108.1 hypothetical protein [Bacillus paranthracis]
MKRYFSLFAFEGLRGIFYFGSGFYTGDSFNTILGIRIVGLVIYLLSIFKPVREQNNFFGRYKVKSNCMNNAFVKWSYILSR